MSTDPDPKHESQNVLRQIEGSNANFVLDYALEHRETSTAQRQQIMSYFASGQLWALHGLARNFTVCDRWFSSVPGPTWTNRLFALSGTAIGRVKMPTGIFDLNLHNYNQETIFDRLSAARVPWKIYFSDFPLSLLLANVRKRARSLCRIKRFFEDTKGAEADFPAFSFIEPGYLWPKKEDDHPPHDVMRGQRLIARVYNALRANEDLWARTLLVVNYDEHGGFYDHVSPPAALPPDQHRDEYTFDRYGVRVPSILVSPWAEQGVFHGELDHTSLLRYVSDLWGLAPLGRRAAGVGSFAPVLGHLSEPRRDTPLVLQEPGVRRALRAVSEAGPAPDLNDNQRAILALSQLLERDAEDQPERKLARSMRLMEGPANQHKIAAERAIRFLRQRGADV